MPVMIRRAQPEDGPGIARVRVLGWQAAYRGLVPDAVLDAMDVQAETKRWSDGLANLPVERCVLVAIEIENDSPMVAGFCACGPEREMDPEYSAEIYALYVLPGRQSKGTGRALLQGACAWLHGQGHKRMVVYTLRDNHPARRFYEAVGGALARDRMWDIHGEKKPEVGYGFDLQSMSQHAPPLA